MIYVQSIGPYRILRPLGEGGMGQVYEAVQAEPVRRRVALKVLRPHPSGVDSAARFAAEQQALAVMDHPGIAKVFDAGTTEDGRQWFAMELVEGRPLTAFADAEGLGVPERLELITRICRAVQHAHQKGVIHRDLKPSNVLVVRRDGEPAPKIIDFGVAKAVGLRLTEATLVTQFGAVIGTPAYMSPEQAEGTALDVDTRADVYSLGVMLYELLVGCLPVDPQELGYPGFIAYLKEPTTQPPTPVNRFATLDPERQSTAARHRSTTPERLREQLAGDLGWIAMTALEKERARRYDSAGALGADLERYLRREPVAARPPTTAYQLRKFVSRNRVAMGAAVAVVAALAIGATATTVGMVRARDEARVAQREAATSERVSGFLATVFAQADPQQSRGREVTVRQVLDQAAARIDTELSGEPLVQARLMREIGDAYRGLGYYAEARPLLTRGLKRAEASGDEILTASLQHDLGYLLTFLSEYQAADSLLRASLATFLRNEGEGSDWTVTVRDNLAFNALRSGKGVAEADSMLREAYPAQVAALGETNPNVAIAAYMRCWTLRDLGRRIAADSACAVSLHLITRALGEDAPQVVYNTLAVGHVRRALGRWASAREAYRKAIAGNQRLFPEGHPETAYGLEGLAMAYQGENMPDSALPYAEQAVSMLERTLEPNSTELAAGINTLAEVLADLRRFDEAESTFLRGAAVDSAMLGVESRRYARRLGQLGDIRLQRGDFTDAYELHQRSLRLMRRVEPPGSPQIMEALDRTGQSAHRVGELHTAEPLLREALSMVERTPADYPLERARIRLDLARLLVDLGRYDEACELADGARTGYTDALGPADWRVAAASAVLGRCRVRQGKRKEGAALLRAADARLHIARLPGDLYRRDAAAWVAELEPTPSGR